MWAAVDALIDRAPSVDDLRAHRLEVLAARRWRALGRDVPDDFVAEARLAAVAALTAPLVLERIRAVTDAELVVLKGPEVAAAYADASLRGFRDLDVLVSDAEAIQRMLVAAGFEPIGDPGPYRDIHHLRPLATDGLPLTIEVHARPKWVEPLAPPPVEELLEAAVPGSTGVEGVLVLPPAHHAVLTAVHSWAHEPLRRLRDLVDVAAVTSLGDRVEAAALARRWGVERLWRTTIAAADALLGLGPTPFALRLWAQNLPRVRERTVLENHFQRCLSDFWALPPRLALARLPRTVATELRPHRDEGWPEKLSRASRALKNAPRPRSVHDSELADGGRDYS